MSARISIVESFSLPLEPKPAYDFLLSESAFRMFDGYGPIPGIERLEWQHGGDSGTVGSIGTVHSNDGGTHRETVRVADSPREYAIGIDEFSSAFRFLTTGATERWLLSPGGPDSTFIVREFSFKLRSPLLWPAGRVLGMAFRKAVQRNHENFRRHFALTKDPAPKL